MTETLVQRAQSGEHEAFLELLAAHDTQVMSVIYRFTGDQYDREDLYQEIFLHAFQSIRRFKGQAAFATWLYRLAFNRCVTYMQRNTPTEPSVEETDVAATPPDWERRAKLHAVQRALRRLKGSQRIAFHLYYIEDWTAEAVAEVLDCSVGTVKSHLQRAREKVKRHQEVRTWVTT